LPLFTEIIPWDEIQPYLITEYSQLDNVELDWSVLMVKIKSKLSKPNVFDTRYT